MERRKDVLVIAHRGANRKAPQNTMPAFRQAVADGCDGFETDVHLSRDGEVVICHNATIDEMSDGKGEITSYTLAELRQFDFGRKFAAEYEGTRMPTLDEFLELAVSAELKLINIEIKCPKAEMDKLVRRTLDLVAKHACLDRVVFSSFSPAVLRLVKLYCPQARTALLYPTNRPEVCPPLIFPVLLAKKLGAEYLHPMAPMVTHARVKIAHAMGFGVNVWTVNDPRTVNYLCSCGVDGIITDTPDRVAGYLGRE